MVHIKKISIKSQKHILIKPRILLVALQRDLVILSSDDMRIRGKIVSDDFHKEFASLVYTILVLDKRWSMKDVAAKLDMKYPTFYARVHERVEFSLAEAVALLKVMPDQRLASYLLDGSSFIAVKQDDYTNLNEEENLHRGATRTVLEASDILREVEKAIEDEKVDHQDRRRIQVEIEEAERALASLREKLKIHATE